MGVPLKMDLSWKIPWKRMIGWYPHVRKPSNVKYMKNMKPPARYWLWSQEFVNHNWSNIAHFLQSSKLEFALPHPPHYPCHWCQSHLSHCKYSRGTTFSVQDDLTSSRGFHWWPQEIPLGKAKTLDQSKGIMAHGVFVETCRNSKTLKLTEYVRIYIYT